MNADLTRIRDYSQRCCALASALLDRDWFETGTLLREFVEDSGKPISCEQIQMMMLATGQTSLPTRERIRQSRSVRNHFVANGLGRQDARGVSLDTARLLCQHHRQGRLDGREFRQAVSALQRSCRTFRAGASTANIRTLKGARELLDLV